MQMAAKTPKKNRNPKLVSNDKQTTVPYAIVEAYKSLRVHLTSILSKTDGKIIAVSSPNASEGKSTTSVNIAIMLAQLNKKVLLIDTDARRASIHQKLKLENKLGCLDILAQQAELKDAIQNYSKYLDVLTTGKSVGNSSELFDSPTFDSLLSEVRNTYDYVIVDTPPINLVSDSLVVSQKCDGLLLIIRSTITTYEAFKQSLASVEHLNINLLGTVINGVGANAGKYYKHKKYYGYNKYNKYYNSKRY
jgi:capsular exopolysaccharide synthesis family protein